MVPLVGTLVAPTEASGGLKLQVAMELQGEAWTQPTPLAGPAARGASGRAQEAAGGTPGSWTRRRPWSIWRSNPRLCRHQRKAKAMLITKNLVMKNLVLLK